MFTTLFWKKGLEAALLCYVIIGVVLYLIAPLVVDVVAA
jgi:hypothetical protein